MTKMSNSNSQEFCKLRSRFLSDLTSPEVEAYLKAGGKTAYIPAGAVEMHGPHLPIGTDVIIAKGFSLLIGEQTNGIVFPEISYSWAGATEGFAGTVSIPPEMVIELATWIAVKAYKMGFRRIVIVSIHGTNDAPLTICIRRLYETHGIIAQYLNPFRSVTPEAADLFIGQWKAGKEASLLLAALDMLGNGDLYTEKEIAYDDQSPPLNIRKMDFMGTTGFYYQDLRHHVAPSQYTSKERGKKFMNIQVKSCIPGILNLDKYTQTVQKEKNQGWFR